MDGATEEALAQAPAVESAAGSSGGSGPRLPELLGKRRCCRWLLTLIVPGPASHSLEAILSELRRLTEDDSLSCQPPSPAPVASERKPERQRRWVLVIESSWRGYFALTRAARRTSPLLIGGCTLASLEPRFTEEYLKLCQNSTTRPLLMENLVHVYSPLFVNAAKLVRYKFSGIGLPSEEDLVLSAWEGFIKKIDKIIRGYNSERGSQSDYVFTIAKNAAFDCMRGLAKEQNIPLDEDPDGRDGPFPPRPLQEVLESRDLLRRILKKFEQLCAASRETKDPTDWQFFQEHFMEEVSKEEMCKRYKMTESNFYKRVSRIRIMLRELLKNWKKNES